MFEELIGNVNLTYKELLLTFIEDFLFQELGTQLRNIIDEDSCVAFTISGITTKFHENKREYTFHIASKEKYILLKTISFMNTKSNHSISLEIRNCKDIKSRKLSFQNINNGEHHFGNQTLEIVFNDGPKLTLLKYDCHNHFDQYLKSILKV